MPRFAFWVGVIPALSWALTVGASPAVAAPPPAAATLLTGSSPARDAARTDAVAEVTLAFARKVELFSVTIIPPVGEEISLFQTDYAPGSPKLTGTDFAFTLAEPLAKPGEYSIAYGYTVTNADSSLSSVTDIANFTIR